MCACGSNSGADGSGVGQMQDQLPMLRASCSVGSGALWSRLRDALAECGVVRMRRERPLFDVVHGGRRGDPGVGQWAVATGLS